MMEVLSKINSGSLTLTISANSSIMNIWYGDMALNTALDYCSFLMVFKQ